MLKLARVVCCLSDDNFFTETCCSSIIVYNHHLYAMQSPIGATFISNVSCDSHDNSNTAYTYQMTTFSQMGCSCRWFYVLYTHATQHSIAKIANLNHSNNDVINFAVLPSFTSHFICYFGQPISNRTISNSFSNCCLFIFLFLL